MKISTNDQDGNVLYELDYLGILNELLTAPGKAPARDGMPPTRGVTMRSIRHKHENGFPLVTTKPMYKRILGHELAFFLRGMDNVDYLEKHGVKIWTDDAYKFYKRVMTSGGVQAITEAEFKDRIGQDMLEAEKKAFGKVINMDASAKEALVSNLKYGWLGHQYGTSWRNYNWAGFDQLSTKIEQLKANPSSRRVIVTANNPMQEQAIGLFHCHSQFHIVATPIFKEGSDTEVENYVFDMVMFQRSADTILGVPYNLASYALLLEIIAKYCGAIAGETVIVLSDCHMYSEHIEAAKEQIQRQPLGACKLTLDIPEDVLDLPASKFFDNFDPDWVKFEDYNHHAKLENDTELFTGA